MTALEQNVRLADDVRGKALRILVVPEVVEVEPGREGEVPEEPVPKLEVLVPRLHDAGDYFLRLGRIPGLLTVEYKGTDPTETDNLGIKIRPIFVQATEGWKLQHYQALDMEGESLGFTGVTVQLCLNAAAPWWGISGKLQLHQGRVPGIYYPRTIQPIASQGVAKGGNDSSNDGSAVPTPPSTSTFFEEEENGNQEEEEDTIGGIRDLDMS